jgi:hypothetical protein
VGRNCNSSLLIAAATTADGQLIRKLVFLFCGMMLLLAVLKQSFLGAPGSNQRIEDK